MGGEEIAARDHQPDGTATRDAFWYALTGKNDRLPR